MRLCPPWRLLISPETRLFSLPARFLVSGLGPWGAGSFLPFGVAGRELVDAASCSGTIVEEFVSRVSEFISDCSCPETCDSGESGCSIPAWSSDDSMLMRILKAWSKMSCVRRVCPLTTIASYNKRESMFYFRLGVRKNRHTPKYIAKLNARDWSTGPKNNHVTQNQGRTTAPSPPVSKYLDECQCDVRLHNE